MYEWRSSGSPSLTLSVSQPVVPEMWPLFCVTWLMNQMVEVTSVQTKPYLPNCPPGTNYGNKEIIRKQGWVVSSDQFDIVICWLKSLLAHFWSSVIIELVGHYSHFIFDTGAERKIWTSKSYRWDLIVPLLIAWHYYLWHCRDHRGFESKDGATKLCGPRTSLSDPR